MCVIEGATAMGLALGLNVGGTNMYGILVDQTGRIAADLEPPTHIVLDRQIYRGPFGSWRWRPRVLPSRMISGRRST